MDIEKLRVEYQHVLNNPSAARMLWKKLEYYKGDHAVVYAYKAALGALVARAKLNPFDKLSGIKQSMELFRKAFQLDPDNLEVRFLRFAIQSNIPAYLQMSVNLTEDKNYIIDQWASFRQHGLEQKHLKIFLDYLGKSKGFSDEELNQLELSISA